MTAPRVDVMQRVLRALPLLVATVTLWLAGPEGVAPVALALALLASIAVGPRLPLDKPTQRLTSLVIVILVIAAVRAAGIPIRGPRLGAFAFAVASAPLAVATARLFVADAEWGYVVTAVLAFLSVMACGASPLGPLYGALVAAQLAATLVALRAEDRFRVPAHRVPRSAAAVGALIVALACLLAVATALVLRPLQEIAQRRIDQSFQEHMLSRVMFSDSMRLGKMTQLLRSNRVVMRLRGARVDYLRGAALDYYDGHRWVRGGGGQPAPVVVPKGPLQGADVVEIDKVGDDGDRVFLPFDVTAVALAEGTLRADTHGIARAAREGDVVAWARIGKPRSVLPIATFEKGDLEVPPSIAPAINALAREWAEGTHDPDATLVALARHLRSEFAYSLASEHDTLSDPMLDFLFVHRTGHCEYFASALTLLARSVGIPARVVTGYRVAEQNPLLRHYVVRERNAHAWVEALVPGRGWVTYDPTPMSELAHDLPHEESGLAAVTELVLAAAGRAEKWLAERTVGELSIAAALGLVVFGLVRFFGAKKPAPELTSSAALAFAPPLAAYAAFEAQLGKRGLARAADEPLERFAARAPAPLGALVLRYARARYAGEDDARLEADLRAATQSE